jgi:hypothetical protein
MMGIPEEIHPSLERAYRAEFSTVVPEVADDCTFYSALADAGAWWHIFGIVWRVSEAIERDWRRGLSSARQQALALLDNFARLSIDAGRWPALGRSSEIMADRLRANWPDVAPLPRYPAFLRA